MRYLIALLLTFLFLTKLPAVRAVEPDPKLAQQARAILEKNCYRCHGQGGVAKDNSMNYVLNPAELIKKKKILAGNAADSKLYRKVAKGEMPLDDDGNPRPLSADDVDLLKRWIDAGAPALPAQPVVARPFLNTGNVLLAMRDHLRKLDPEDRPYQRYFTLTHLHNLYRDKDKDQYLRRHRAALSKLLNSLSWKRPIVVPEAVDKAQTVFAIDLRDLDWDRHRLWQAILKAYPYGLAHDQYPDERESRELAREVYDMTGTELPAVRADWFVATASRPPLYHELLRLPTNAGELERRLDVDVRANFRRDRLTRAGFAKNGVSEHNRLVERHESLYGAYWKSYDFKDSDGRGNLINFPLGPVFQQNPFPDLAFEHAGGEIIFNLPNGLQGYLLVNAKDERINEGPIEIVSDKDKTAGTPVVVNGISCISCHAKGMKKDFGDAVRKGTPAAGRARDKVRRLYPEDARLQKLLEEDETRFLQAVDRAIAPFGPFLRDDAKSERDLVPFLEPIGPLARWYRVEALGPEEVAAELGLADVKRLKSAIQDIDGLRELGLGPLTEDGEIKRETWESVKGFTSPFQEAARILKQGNPRR